MRSDDTNASPLLGCFVLLIISAGQIALFLLLIYLAIRVLWATGVL